MNPDDFEKYTNYKIVWRQLNYDINPLKLDALDTIEQSLDRREFSEANAVIDHIKGLK